MDIIKINLENEMDLILAHKRSMKLAELCGLSVITQTSFATAVSEISRCVIGDETDQPTLTLCINVVKNNKKELVASIISNKDFEKNYSSALTYAKRLTTNLNVANHKLGIEVQIIQSINFSNLINDAKLDSFINYFKTELPLSAYDELRKKNIQLLEVSEKLRDSENQYKVLTETLPLMVFTTNPGGIIHYANKWFKDFFKLADIPQGKLHWTNLVKGNLNQQIIEEWEKSMIAQGPLRTQAKLSAKESGETIWHLISMIPVKNEQNQTISWTGIFVDIHAQKLVEETLKNNEQLKSAQKQLLNYQKKLEDNIGELNRSNHDLEQFAYIASHDLQEPLRKIRTFSDLLKRNIDDKQKAVDYLAKIDKASGRMITLIKDVLNYSSLTKSASDFVEVDLQQTLSHVLGDMELLIQDKNAQIKADPLPVMQGNPQQLYQLFYNFISNSLKFCTDKPEITISCATLDKATANENPELSKGGNYFELVFKDNGIGFNQDSSKSIFTIFKRLNSKESYPGTGIGLALCKKIVENHLGSINAKGTLGKGAEFHVILPFE